MMPLERRKSSRLENKPEDGEKKYGSETWGGEEARERSSRVFQVAEEASDYDEEDYENKPEDGEKKYGSETWGGEEARERSSRVFQVAEEASDYDEEDYENYEIRKKKSNPGRCEKDPNVNV